MDGRQVNSLKPVVESFENLSNSDLNISEENQTPLTYTASSEASSDGASYEIFENPLAFESDGTDSVNDVIDYPSSLSSSASALTTSSETSSETTSFDSSSSDTSNYSTTDSSGYSSDETTSSECSDAKNSEESESDSSTMEDIFSPTNTASSNPTFLLPILTHLIEGLDSLRHLQMHLRDDTEHFITAHERELLDSAILHTQLAKIKVTAEIPEVSVCQVSIFALPIIRRNVEPTKENVDNLTFTQR